MFEETVQMIPSASGSYLLWLHLPESQNLIVGKLGQFTFPAGDYVYLGSARGSGGLRARLGRHLRGSGKRHWHIDYLRAAAQVRGYGYEIQPGRGAKLGDAGPRECAWSQKLGALLRAGFPAPSFGASDCHAGCTAHLVHFSGHNPQIAEIIQTQIGSGVAWGQEGEIG